VPGAPPIGAIVVAVAIINLRMLLMSATLRPLTVGVPRWQAIPAMFFVSDEQWALTMSELNRGRGTLAFALGAGVLAWFAWMASTLAGRLLGAVIADPRAWGIDFAFTATFLALLFGMWKGRGDIVPWAVGGLVAILVSRLVPGQWYVIAGGLSGSLVGALTEWRSRV
jgi:predicted branched-subunit amino acid permease